MLPETVPGGAGIESGQQPGGIQRFCKADCEPETFCLDICICHWRGDGEEIGWRDLLQPEMEKKYPHIVAAVSVGVIWEVMEAARFFLRFF